MTRVTLRYASVYAAIKKQIENMDYKIGDFLPPEPELQKQFGVSRVTVRKAVELLARQGFVNIQQGRGTSVLDFKTTQKLQFVTSFSETLQERGFIVDHRLLSIDTENPSDRIAGYLGITRNDPVVRIERIAYANKMPIALMTNYLVAALVPGIEKKADRIKSLYRFLEEEYTIFVDSATDCISADVTSEKEVDLLGILPGVPLLTARRVSCRNSIPVELVFLRIVADKYEFYVYTKDRPLRSSGGFLGVAPDGIRGN
jgi:GntR family transcriptional regulator